MALETKSYSFEGGSSKKNCPHAVFFKVLEDFSFSVVRVCGGGGGVVCVCACETFLLSGVPESDELSFPSSRTRE